MMDNETALVAGKYVVYNAMSFPVGYGVGYLRAKLGMPWDRRLPDTKKKRYLNATYCAFVTSPLFSLLIDLGLREGVMHHFPGVAAGAYMGAIKAMKPKKPKEPKNRIIAKRIMTKLNSIKLPTPHPIRAYQNTIDENELYV